MFYFELGLGFLTYPFIILSTIALALVIERVAVLFLYQKNKTHAKGAENFLTIYQEKDKCTREELALIWLDQQQKQLQKGIRIIHIVAIISPLLGLMGTVFGLIQVFSDISQHTGPIEPSLLAAGLGLAMKTTAAGLVISVPCLISYHLLHLWIDQLLQRSEKILNILNLKFSGVRLEY